MARAIAVLAVVSFHAGFPGFEGRFLGVDVFLVISGYLIIVRDLEAQRFSFKHFYERKQKRAAVSPSA